MGLGLLWMNRSEHIKHWRRRIRQKDHAENDHKLAHLEKSLVIKQKKKKRKKNDRD